MKIFHINVLNNKINDIKYANDSNLHEYYNKFDGKSLIKIFFIRHTSKVSLVGVVFRA